MHLHIQKIVLVTLIVVAMPGLSFSQGTTAVFAGIVTDSTGAVLPGAEVEMINEGTAAVLQLLTSETGEFVYNFVPPGTYTLKIALPGFRTYESRAIPLGAAQRVRRTYILEVGNITDNVTVTGEAPLVNTVSAEQRVSMETTEIKDLPAINRNITNLLEFTTSGMTRNSPSSTGTGQTTFRINGLPPEAFSIMSDGVDSNAVPGTPGLGEYGGSGKIDQMGAEAVSELQIIKGVMPAEYGSAMAGTVSLITKSGSNDWHGSLFHRYEGAFLSARQATLTTKTNMVWNQFGGSLGGPIKRDRAFFFFAYEGYRQRGATALNMTTMTPYFKDIALRSLPFPQTPLFLNFFPTPNQPYGPTDLTARWVGPGQSENNDDHFDWKVDYLVGGGNLFVSYAGGHPFSSEARQNPLNPQQFITKNQRVSVNYLIGPGSWSSSTRVGYNKHTYQRLDKFFLQKDPTFEEQTFGAGRIPTFIFPGLSTPSTQFNSRGLIPSYFLEQQLVLIRGAHSFKFGGVLSLPSGGRTEVQAQDVAFETLAELQRNEPSSIPANWTTPYSRWRNINFGAFLQDDWRFNQKLVLNLGVRYDRFGHMVVHPLKKDGPPAAFYNLDGLRDAVNFVWGPLRPTDNSIESDNFNLAPRFGFAYRMDNTGDFVLRGGFGINFQAVNVYDIERGAIAPSPYLPAAFTYTKSEVLQYGLKYPATKPQMDALTASISGSTPRLGFRYDPNLRGHYAYNYTLGIQRALTKSMVLETAYVGTRGVKLQLVRTYNLPDRLTGIKPNPADITSEYRDNSGQSVYHSWQSSLKQRWGQRMSFNVSHTWGKGMAYERIEDFNEVQIERTVASGDRAHSAIVQWVYRAPTPFANSVLGRQVLGGWQISGFWTGRTGTALSISQRNIGAASGLPAGRPDVIDFDNLVNKNCCSFGNLQFINPAALKSVPIISASGRTARRGYMAPNVTRGPGYNSFNVSLGKSFPLGEGGKALEFKADMQNALNQTNYQGVVTSIDTRDFGKAIGTAPAREIQLQLRLSF